MGPWGNEKKGGLGPVRYRRGGRGATREANKASGVTTVANGSLARGDIGIESVYARQVPERDRDRERENAGYDGGKRVRGAGETEGNRERREERE